MIPADSNPSDKDRPFPLATLIAPVVAAAIFRLVTADMDQDKTLIFIACADTSGLAGLGDAWVRCGYSFLGSVWFAVLAVLLTPLVLPFVISGCTSLGSIEGSLRSYAVG
jgi:hypothetical protein